MSALYYQKKFPVEAIQVKKTFDEEIATFLLEKKIPYEVLPGGAFQINDGFVADSSDWIIFSPARSISTQDIKVLTDNDFKQHYVLAPIEDYSPETRKLRKGSKRPRVDLSDEVLIACDIFM